MMTTTTTTTTMTTRTSKIEPSSPGYTWYYTLVSDDRVKVELYWTPLENIYSPPVFEHGMCMLTLVIPEWFPIGLLIGKNGVHFKMITESTGCYYLFYRNGQIEVWGVGDAPYQARTMLQDRIVHLHLQQQRREQQPLHKGGVFNFNPRQEFNDNPPRFESVSF
jgi:hypothetical protein